MECRSIGCEGIKWSVVWLVLAWMVNDHFTCALLLFVMCVFVYVTVSGV